MCCQRQYIDLVFLNKLVNCFGQVFIVNEVTIKSCIRIFFTQSFAHSFKHRFVQFAILPLIDMQTNKFTLKRAHQFKQFIQRNKILSFKIGCINNCFEILKPVLRSIFRNGQNRNFGIENNSRCCGAHQIVRFGIFAPDTHHHHFRRMYLDIGKYIIVGLTNFNDILRMRFSPSLRIN